MRPYGLVVFDFDGTLADSFPWFCGVLNEVAARYRFRQVGTEEIETLRGMDLQWPRPQLDVAGMRAALRE